MLNRSELPQKDLLILDLDNTIWDWFQIWHEYFNTMLDGILPLVEIERDALLEQIRHIHQKHGTSEYAFLLHELPALLAKFGDTKAIDEALLPVVREFRRRRKRATVLYSGVGDFLHLLRPKGVRIVGYTDSLSFYSHRRFKTLALDGVFDVLFSPPDHETPPSIERHYDNGYYKLHITKHEHTPEGALKPDADVLRSILESERVSPEQAVYAGDSLIKDIAMAQDVGVLDAWAKYGLVQHRVEYDLLREVSHWTQADVDREKQITQRDVVPSIVLEHGLSELLKYVRFGDDV